MFKSIGLTVLILIDILALILFVAAACEKSGTWMQWGYILLAMLVVNSVASHVKTLYSRIKRK